MSQKLLGELKRLYKLVEDAKNLRMLADRPEWKALEVSVQESMAQKVNELCSVDCDDKTTLTLRAELRALRWFIRIPKVSETEFAKRIQDYEVLRQRVDRAHNVGQISQADYEMFSEEAFRLTRQFEVSP